MRSPVHLTGLPTTFVANNAANGFPGRGLDGPVFSTSIGVIATDQIASRYEELIFPVNIVDYWSGVVGDCWPRDVPNLLARFAIVGSKVSTFFVVRGDDDEFIV